MKSEPGYTLIELLGVIVIVGLLATILTGIVVNGFEYGRVGAKRSHGVREATSTLNRLVHGEKRDGLIAAVEYEVSQGSGRCDELIYQTADGTVVRYYVADSELFRQRADTPSERLMTGVRRFQVQAQDDGVRISLAFELPAPGGSVVCREVHTFARLRNLVRPTIVLHGG